MITQTHVGHSIAQKACPSPRSMTRFRPRVQACDEWFPPRPPIYMASTSRSSHTLLNRKRKMILTNMGKDLLTNSPPKTCACAVHQEPWSTNATFLPDINVFAVNMEHGILANSNGGLIVYLQFGGAGLLALELCKKTRQPDFLAGCGGWSDVLSFTWGQSHNSLLLRLPSDGYVLSFTCTRRP